MGLVAFIKSQFIPRNKLRLLLLVHMVLFLLGVCLLGYVMHLQLSKDACFQYFIDLLDDCVEVFMDDFSVYGTDFSIGLDNLSKVLDRCIDHGLVLNWEKCHFMAQEGIVLGHLVSKRGIEVDRAKIEIIANLPSPKCVKDIRSFLGHAGFYRRFIKDFF